MTKPVQDAYIVAATRTPIGRSHKGYFKNTRPDDLLAHVLREVLAQAPGLDPAAIEATAAAVAGLLRKEPVHQQPPSAPLELAHP